MSSTHTRLQSNITRERLMRSYHYNPETGEFRRRFETANGHPAWSIAGSITKSRVPYLVIRIDRVLYLCHRLAWLYVHGEMPPVLIDHRDENGLNNSIANLRLATDTQNKQAPTRPTKASKSGLRGACFDKRGGKWIAAISLDGKTVHIGRYDTADLAHEAYMDVKRRRHFQ